MKIVVIGGRGLVGAKLLNTLRHRGHDVLAASRRSGVDIVTGEGLSQALAGAKVLVDVTNSPSFADTAVLDFFRDLESQPARRRRSCARETSRCAVDRGH